MTLCLNVEITRIMFKILNKQECLFLCSVDISSAEEFLKGGKLPVLTVRSAGHALHIFVNGQLSGMLHIRGSSIYVLLIRQSFS